MSNSYDIYLSQHRFNVSSAFMWIKNNLPNLIDPSYEFKHQIIFLHDQSKYSIEEYDAYDAYFYGEPKEDPDVVDPQKTLIAEAFNRAWLLHIHNNPHHWQYWVLINDNGGDAQINAIEMPYNYVIEMICDWWSFSWSSDNLYEIFTWYNDHKDDMILHSNTRTLVEEILYSIDTKLKELDAAKDTEQPV